MEIFFIVLCVFFSCIACIKIVLIEKYLDIVSSEFIKNSDMFNKYIININKIIMDLKQDNFDLIEGLKKDLESKISDSAVYFEESFCELDKSLENNFSDLICKLEYTENEIKEVHRESIELFQKERVEIEKLKSLKSTSTFKSLKAAFSPNGAVNKDED